MVIDYGEGKYVLYGQFPEKPRVGWAEDGFAYSDSGTWKFRLGNEQIYGLGGDIVGWVENGVVSTNTGHFIFIIE